MFSLSEPPLPLEIESKDGSSWTENACQDFPLMAEHFDPSLSVWYPTKCHRQLSIINQEKMQDCMKDKTILVIGDSRAGQIFMELSALLGEKEHTVER